MRPVDLLRIVLLAAIYAGVARLGLMMDAVGGFATLVWPPTGIALVALLVFGYRLWPGIAIGAFVVNAWTGAPIAAAIGIAIGNTLEAVLAKYLLGRVDFSRALERVRDVIALVALAALVSPIVSATLGVTSLWLAGVIAGDGAGGAWRAWWLGDAVGNLVVAPLLLCVASASARRLPRRQLAEAAVLLVALVAVGLFIFGDWHGIGLRNLRQSYLVFPLLIWAALRFGVRGAAFGTFIIVAIAIAGTASGVGPFAGAQLSASLFALQAFMAVVAATILVLGAVIDERDDAVRRREELLEMVSHELKNPLATLQLSAEVMLAKVAKDESLTKRATVVQRSSDRMAALIQQLLDLGAIESNRLAIEPHEEDARSIVEEALELARPVAADKAQTVEVELPAMPLSVLCDRSRTLQVISNLLGNAVKFSPDRAAITLALEPAGDTVRFAVRDTGPGLSGEELAHVFDRYWRADRRSSKGSGLGLFISKTLVETQGGKLWVESKPGEGCVFKFTLPVATTTRPS